MIFAAFAFLLGLFVPVAQSSLTSLAVTAMVAASVVGELPAAAPLAYPLVLIEVGVAACLMNTGLLVGLLVTRRKRIPVARPIIELTPAT